jgi:glutaredoxin
MKYKVEIEKISYAYVIVDAEDGDEAFDYAESNVESLFNEGVESVPDVYNVFDEILEA